MPPQGKTLPMSDAALDRTHADLAGLAAACAAAALTARHPVRDVLPVVAARHARSPLTPPDLDALAHLVRARLAVDPDPRAARAAARWGEQVLTRARLRGACGLEPHSDADAVRAWLASSDPAPLLSRHLSEVTTLTLDWSVDADEPPTSPADVVERMARAGADVGIGRYCEDRAVYRTEAYADPDGGDPRTVHLGVDLFAPAGTVVHAPYDGEVLAFNDNTAPLDYGPVILLAHRTDDGLPFVTLHGHLSRESLPPLCVGAPVGAGQPIATFGTVEENGGWAPHVHTQVLLDLLGLGVDVPGVAPRGELELWRSLSPDPMLLLR